VIEFQDVAFAYPGGTDLFSHFDLHIERNQAWAILGPSGCGKTTFLYLLAALLAPTEGYIKIDNEPLRRPRPQTGLILQDYGLLPWATVRENAALGLRLRSFYGPDGRHAPRDERVSDIEPRVDHWLERLGIESVSGQYPGQISGGQRQRAAIARTLTLQPDLLLMDEPFASLDIPTRESLQELILEFRVERNLTTVIVTHTVEEAAILGEWILLLNKPPNTHPKVLHNPGGAHSDFRSSEAYLHTCETLRQSLGEAQ
jgi:NitT/TauT family transport system ATP-binding protein